MNIFFRHLKKYRAASILAPAFKLMEALFELFVPIFVADMVDRGVGNGDTSVIVRDTIIIIAFGFSGLIFSIIGQYFSAKAATGLSHDVRERTYKKMLSLPASEVDRIGVPAMITAMTSDINQMQSGVNLALRLLLRSPFVVFGALIAAMIIDVKISSVFAVLIFALFAVVIIIMAKYSAAQKNLDGVSASARENLTGARVIRAFGAEDAEVKNYGNKTAKLEKSQNFAGTVSALLNPLTFAIVNLGIVALLYFGGVRVNSGALTQGKIIALYDYMSQILIELVKFANLVVTISRALACGKRIDGILSIENDESPVKDDDTSDSYIEFRDVSVSYNGGGDSLSHVDLKVGKGQTVGIIGATGSGKTTMMNLLTRIYAPTDGKVFFDGKNVSTYTTDELRQRIKVVLQKTALFKGSVRDNIMIAADDASDENLQNALKVAQAEDFVKSKGGADAEIEQGGKNLSGGQRQRLSVARAIAAKPEVLILDDSSSALDYLTDLNMRRAISSLEPRPTVFIVSQRAAAVKNADIIVVLDDGKEVGVGNRDYLYENCSVYREIETSQEKGANE